MVGFSYSNQPRCLGSKWDENLKSHGLIAVGGYLIEKNVALTWARWFLKEIEYPIDMIRMRYKNVNEFIHNIMYASVKLYVRH